MCFAKNIGVLSLVVLVCSSCAAAMTGKVDPAEVNDRIYAEHSQMKRRLPLIERENQILKEEGRQYRLKVRNLAAGVEKLAADLAALSEKLTREAALGEERNRNFQETLDLLALESSRKIIALTEHNKRREENWSKAIRGLNERIGAQQSDFGKELEQLRQESAKRESDLTAQIKNLQAALETRDAEISSLKLSAGVLSTKFDEASLRVEELTKARKAIEKSLASVKAANDKLIKKLERMADEFEERDVGMDRE